MAAAQGDISRSNIGKPDMNDKVPRKVDGSGSFSLTLQQGQGKDRDGWSYGIAWNSSTWD